MKIQVITKIPDVDDNDGNLSDEMFVADICKTNETPMFRPYNNGMLVQNRLNFKIPVKLEVFHLGEIIIVDDTEREIGGWFRKASKWHVSYKLFEPKNLDKAVALSNKVTKKTNE